MRSIFSKTLTVLLLVSFAVSQIACTKEKAEALKTAAKDFRTQASVAIDRLDKLFVDEVAIAPLSKDEVRDQIINDLKIQPAGVTTIQTIVNGAELQAQDTSNYRKKLMKIRKTYEDFEEMFQDLPRGHYFAGDAVKKSDALAKKLVAQLVFLAQYIKANPFRLNARIEMAELMREKAVAEPNAVKKEGLYMLLASEILAISSDTKAANSAAILECVKGIEIGLRVVDLIENYEKLSVSDILAIVRDGLTRVNQLTGKNVDSLNKRVDEVHAAMAADPDLNAILLAVTADMNAL